MLSPCWAVDEACIGASDWGFDVVLDIFRDAVMCYMQTGVEKGLGETNSNST